MQQHEVGGYKLVSAFLPLSQQLNAPRTSLNFTGSTSVFPNLFLASAPFSDKQISIAPLPCFAHISTQFFVLYIWDV